MNEEPRLSSLPMWAVARAWKITGPLDTRLNAELRLQLTADIAQALAEERAVNTKWAPHYSEFVKLAGKFTNSPETA